MTTTKFCPDTCPTCGANLKRQGYPVGHQHDATGEECSFSWDESSVLDDDWRERESTEDDYILFG